MKSIPPSVLRFGTDQPEEKPVPLNAGSLTMLFEKNRGVLRYLRMGDHEIIRCIYAAVQDRNWNTIKPEITSVQINQQESNYRLTFDARCKSDEIDFSWKGTIRGDSDGTVVYDFKGTAGSTFLKNRIGICVLHPILECAGKSCTVQKDDGSIEQGSFPHQISPHQPFTKIRELSYEPIPGVKTEVRFTGDVFEMEDQRNWTDASFKTYSTPLEIPFPIEIQQGTTIHQSVTVTVATPERKILPVLLGRGAQLAMSTKPVLSKPRIGLRIPRHKQPLSTREIERLKALNLSHLRIDLHLESSGWIERFRQAAEESSKLRVSLHIALSVTDNGNAELDQFVREFENLRPNVSLWLIFHESKPATSNLWLEAAKQKLSSLSPNVLLASGSNDSFAELNRNRLPPDSQVLPCYSINPQVHAIDHTTLIENLAAQTHTIETVHQFAPRSTVISPITLKPQITSNVTDDEKPLSPAALPPFVDARQMSLFAASWTLGSLARLATSEKVHSLTYFETTGWAGVMETESGSPHPESFQSMAGSVFPVYHLFADIADCNRLYPTHSSHPLQTDGMTLLDSKNRKRILVANFLRESQGIRIKTGTCKARVRYLDETNCQIAMDSPEEFRAQEGTLVESAAGKLSLKLLPCAFARVEIL